MLDRSANPKIPKNFFYSFPIMKELLVISITIQDMQKTLSLFRWCSCCSWRDNIHIDNQFWFGHEYHNYRSLKFELLWQLLPTLGLINISLTGSVHVADCSDHEERNFHSLSLPRPRSWRPLLGRLWGENHQQKRHIFSQSWSKIILNNWTDSKERVKLQCVFSIS